MRNIQILLCAVVLAFCIPVDALYAQNSSKEMRELLKSLKNEKEINCVIDMSQVIIHGKREADFVYVEDISTPEDWTKLWETEYKPSLIHDFLGSFNEHMFDFGHTVRFGNFEQVKYQVRLVLINVSEKGDTIMDAFIEDIQDKEILYKLYVDGTGGVFGSKVNLMSDGFKRAGGELAHQMNVIFKKGRLGLFD